MSGTPDHRGPDSTESLAEVSHELRTPLNAIRGMLELALDEPLSTVLRDYLATAHEAALVLCSVLDDLVDLARAQRGQLEMSADPLEPRSILQAAIDNVRPAAEKRGVSLATRVQAEVPHVLLGDPRRLRQTIETLLEQRTRHTDAETVAVELTTVAADRGAVTLSLDICDASPHESDSPPSPTPPDIEPLKMTMAREWLRHMDGQLVAGSTSGRVSCTLRLKRAPPAAGGPLDGVALSPSVISDKKVELTDRPLNVLVADDTPANQKVVKAVLTKRGHHVELADDGREAVDRVRQHAFDVVLMDAQMPTMNGLEAAATIRRLADDHARVPIIAMTAHAMLYDRQRCLQAGMDDYLSKPIDVAALIARVEYYGAPHEPVEEAAAAADSAGPAAPGIEAARARLGGDEVLLRELIRLFLQDAPALLEKIRIALDERDVEALARAAHNLRGLIGNFDDGAGVAATEAIERLAGQRAFSGMTAALATLEDELSAMHNVLTHHLRHSC